jgi:tetratricopeptide (TPR) repeat protein
MNILNFFSKKKNVITFKQWGYGTTKKNADVFDNVLKALNLTETASVCSVETQQTSLADAKQKNIFKGMGKCYLFNEKYSNIIFPFVPYNIKIKPKIFIDDSINSLPEPVMVVVVAYTFFFLDWHLKMRQRERIYTVQDDERRAMHYCSMFYSECESFKMYLNKLRINNIPINIDGLKTGVIDNYKDGREFGMAVEYLARITALGEWDKGLQREYAEDKEIQEYFEKKLQPVWHTMKKYFSISRNFDDALSDSKELISLLAESSGNEKDLQEVERLREKSMQAFSTKQYKDAVKYGESYLARVKKSGNAKAISLAFTNLHTIFSGMEEYSKAEDLMQELITNAEIGKDYIAIAYANVNSLRNPEILMNRKKSVERFNGCLDSILLLSDEEFQNQKQDIEQLLNGMYQYFPFFAGVKEMKPVADKFIKLFEKVKK